MVLKDLELQNPPVIWIGRQDQNVFVPHLANKEVIFYRKCHYESLTLRVGDNVLISNMDSLNPVDVTRCHIARILYMYELIDNNIKKDPYRAIVQWYSRPNALPRRFLNDEINIDFNLEIIEDYRSFDNDISIETIFDKCEVIFGSNVKTANELLIKTEISKKRCVRFVCRYKFLKFSHRYKLIPLQYTDQVELKSEKNSIELSQNKTKSKMPDFLGLEFVDVNEFNNNNEWNTRSSNSELNLNNNEIQNSKEDENIIDCNRKRLSNDKKIDPNSISPLKKSKLLSNEEILDELLTPEKNIVNLVKGRKSILIETPKSFKNRYVSDTSNSTPQRNKSRKSLLYKNNVEDEDEMQLSTPQKQIRITQKLSKLELTPSRKSSIRNQRKQIIPNEDFIKTLPTFLPCRENEFNNIYKFLLDKIQNKVGGCMYISGVPGTGKTATVTSVIKRLKYESKCEKNVDILDFDYIEINGMKLSEPRQAYVEIYKQLTGKVVSWSYAQTLLEKRFTTLSPRRNTTILLVDELDILCNRRQDVIYNLLDWPNKSTAKLVVITIANTMDLPERILMGRITSRLGLTRLTFSPYTYQQLQEIVNSKLSEIASFKNDALQLVARKVAAVSGDARRALDICRRAVEIYEQNKNESQDNLNSVNMSHVQRALSEMISSSKVQALKHCSNYEKYFLQAIAAEVARTGIEETIFDNVYLQFKSITSFMGVTTPPPGNTLKICSKLGAERLIICEHSRTDLYQKILLNVSTDDIHYALDLVIS